ncbi:hypothetical protein K3495_g2352 [Podosphaera aphanis]|nr:hypothetical protein K3495_g2352 [Podosphaera aphanis]
MSTEQMAQFMQKFLELSVNNHDGPQWRAQELRYFDPDNLAKEYVEFIDGKTLYHNVYSLTARIKAKVVQGDSHPWSSINVARKLDQCLKGKAEMWYTNEITATTRAGLKASHEI